MSPQARVGAACLIVGPLAGLVSVLVEPTVSGKASAQASAALSHAGALNAGLAINAVAAVLVAGGLVWLATAAYQRSPRLAVAGAAVGVLGLFAVMLDNGLMLAASAAAQGLETTQAISSMDRVFTGGLAAVGVISVLNNIGIVVLGIAVRRAGVPQWAWVAVVLGAIVEAVGFGSGNRYVAAIGFAVLTIGFAGVVRTFTAGETAPAPPRAAAQTV